jgi:hypothetical protein
LFSFLDEDHMTPDSRVFLVLAPIMDHVWETNPGWGGTV